MEILSAILIGILFASGIYMVLSRRLMRIIFGLNLIGNGTLQFIMTSGRLQRGEAPILEGITETATAYADPIPQAITLTAIIVHFAATAFCLVLAYRTFQETGSDDVAHLLGKEADRE